jgi:transcriptional regulator with GAF, ATPase, and Fis domain
MGDSSDLTLPSTAMRHLACLRGLLRRDYLADAGWESALKETAEMACAALGADEALVGLFDPPAETWEAWTSRGDRVRHDAIHLVASRSVLDAVRTSGEPILTTAAAALPVRSESVREHQVRSVLAVPLRLHPGGAGGPAAVTGCLYADRRRDAAPFSDSDVELVRDLAALAERTLPLLRRLAHAEVSLATIRSEVETSRSAAAAEFFDGHYASRDRTFVESVLAPLERAARAGKVGLLLLGPTGSGKSHLARAFHYTSKRREGPFVVLDCGQVTSAEALAAELFGYAKRSGFAAPAEGRIGKALMANGGTLFIDEIGALPRDLQQRLLRLIQSGRFSALGSGEELVADIQVVAAANQDLAEMVRRGAFREDLYWRISEVTLHLPPLDQRPADIPGFARWFLAAARTRFDRPEITGFTAAALAALARHRWSAAGNLRGLEHTINRSVLLAPDGATVLDAADLAFRIGECAVGGRPCLGDAEIAAAAAPDAHAELLRAKIAEHRGNLGRIAADREVIAALAPGRRALAPSTLLLRIRRGGLGDALAQARARAGPDLEAICAALRQHGDAGAAAAALGITRNRLMWRLRRAGLSVRAVLAAGDA